MDHEIRHEEGKRYYIQLEDQVAEASYGMADGQTRDFRHTYVPHEMRGQGIAEKLIRHALDDTLQSGHRFIPSCPFVERFVERHPEYEKGLARSTSL